MIKEYIPLQMYTFLQLSLGNFSHDISSISKQHAIQYHVAYDQYARIDAILNIC